MADLMDLIQSQVSDSLIDNLSDHLGVSNRKQTANASNAIISVLTNALSRNASSSSGASALASALDKDHDGSILDDLGGLLTGSDRGANPRMLNGAGILGHLLGNRQNGIIDLIAQMSGLNKNKTASLMVKLAPMILGMLGKAKKQKNLDSGGLSDILARSVQKRTSNQSQSDFFTRILDRDGDGSMMDEMAEMGMKALGGLFR